MGTFANSDKLFSLVRVALGLSDKVTSFDVKVASTSPKNGVINLDVDGSVLKGVLADGVKFPKGVKKGVSVSICMDTNSLTLNGDPKKTTAAEPKAATSTSASTARPGGSSPSGMISNNVW